MKNIERQKSLDKKKWLASKKQCEDLSGAMLYCDVCEKQRREYVCGATQEEREGKCLCAKAYNRMVRMCNRRYDNGKEKSTD